MHTTTHQIEAPGATITYDVHGSRDQVPLVLIGSPMDARGFTSLSSYLEDRTLVTYDPRGVHRSPKADGASESTPEQHADDLILVLDAVGAESVDLFASSGGAVNALALVARRPDRVRTLVAHEPPTCTVLPDREGALAASRDIVATYQADGFGPAMAKFLTLISHSGPIDGPLPDIDPAQFGLPTDDDGSRDDPMIGQNLRTCSAFEPDFAALRSNSTTVVIAAGAESGETLTARAAAGVAANLELELTRFPSHHGGFLGGEFGQHGDPESFARALRAIV